MKKIAVLMVVVSTAMLTVFIACKGGGFGKPRADAVAVLMPTSDSMVEGVVEFTRTRAGMRVRVQIKKLTPGVHGFHIHTYGDCRADDAESAGGHFNPQDTAHGAPDAEIRHVGDLGNIEADEAGLAVADFVDPHLTLEGPTSIIGRSVIVHDRADDFQSQPAGNAGKRLACGVIGWASR